MHLLEEGDNLTRGPGAQGLRLMWFMRGLLNNTFYIRLLVLLWGSADAVVAAAHVPSGTWTTPAWVGIAVLSGLNLLLAWTLTQEYRPR